MTPRIFQSLEEDFWFRTIDGHKFRQTLHLPFGGTNVSWSYWNTRDRNVAWTDDPASPRPLETYKDCRDQMLEAGWETEEATAEAAIPVFDWKTWPKSFRFGTALINPNPMMMGGGPFRYFQAVPGVPVIVMIGREKILVMDNNGHPTTMGIKVLEELRDVYPSKTVLRGMYDGVRFHVWDVPFRKGKDNLAFRTFSKRRPRYHGNFVHCHIETHSGSQSDAYWIVEEEVEPEATAYSIDTPTIMSGVFFVRPTPRHPLTHNAPRHSARRPGLLS